MYVYACIIGRFLYSENLRSTAAFSVCIVIVESYTSTLTPLIDLYSQHTSYILDFSHVQIYYMHIIFMLNLVANIEAKLLMGGEVGKHLV